MDLNTETSYVA